MGRDSAAFYGSLICLRMLWMFAVFEHRYQEVEQQQQRFTTCWSYLVVAPEAWKPWRQCGFFGMGGSHPSLRQCESLEKGFGSSAADSWDLVGSRGWGTSLYDGDKNQQDATSRSSIGIWNVYGMYEHDGCSLIIIPRIGIPTWTGATCRLFFLLCSFFVKLLNV